MKKLIIILTLHASLFTFHSSVAQIIHIPGDYPIIQQGIDAADDGDTVLVQQGIYNEHLNIIKSITLASLYILTQDTSFISQTVLTGNQTDGVIAIENTLDSVVCQIIGVTVRDGVEDGGDGGGIYIGPNAAVIISNVHITDNLAERGGGLFCDGSSTVEINNCKINNNVGLYFHPPVAHGLGGGIFCEENTILNVDESEINNNYSLGEGPGIYFSGGLLTMKNVEFSNDSCDTGGGAVIYCDLSSLLFENILISHNSYTGIFIDKSTAEIYNSTISNNYYSGIISWESDILLCNTLIAGHNSNGSAGIFMEDSDVTLNNVTLTENGSPSSEGIYNRSRYKSSTITLHNTICYGNEYKNIVLVSAAMQYNAGLTTSYSNIEGGESGVAGTGIINWLAGNVDADPLFEGIGDHPFQLSAGSLCIDAGNPDTTGLNLPYWDLMGNYRLWDGDEDGDTVVDMGAYEFGSIGVGVEQSPVVSRQPSVTVYPNPTSGVSSFRFQVSCFEHVTIIILDLQGQEVATVVDHMLPAGEQVIRFDASHLPTGVYIYRKSTVNSQQSAIGKLIVVK
jgi:hypothetical protein